MSYKKKISTILRTVSAFLVFLFLVYSFGLNAYAANINDVCIPMPSGKDCVVTCSTNMLRRRAVLDGNSNWNSISYAGVQSVSVKSGVGTLKSYTYSNPGMGLNMSVCDTVYASYTVNATTGAMTHSGNATSNLSYIKSLLNSHPEGIIGYAFENYSKWSTNENKYVKGTKWSHAVLITRYSGDTLYCIDPTSTYFAKGEIPLANSSLADSRHANGGQSKILSYGFKVWYVNKDYNSSMGTINPPPTPTPIPPTPTPPTPTPIPPTPVVNNPHGFIRKVSSPKPNVIEISGYAIDADDYSARLNVLIYVDGKHVATLQANEKDDLVITHGDHDNYHGFSGGFSDITPGVHTIEAIACNIGGGENTSLGNYKIDVQEAAAPVINNYNVTNIDYINGKYTVEANVTSEWGVENAQFPTWTSKNGQDDLKAGGIWYSGYKGNVHDCGNNQYKITYEVNCFDHNGERGDYVTDFYVYNKYGKSTSERKIVNLSPKGEQTIEDGWYHIVSEYDLSYRLDNPGWDLYPKSGDAVQLANREDVAGDGFHGGADEGFRIKYTGDGYYEISRGECALTVEAGGYLSGAKVYMSSRKNIDEQRWVIDEYESDSSDCIRIRSKYNGLSLDINELKIPLDGSEITTGTNTNGIDKRWRLIPAEANFLAEGRYRICSYDSGCSLSVASLSDGVNVECVKRADAVNDIFTLKPSGTEYYEIAIDDYLLDVADEGTSSGTNVQLKKKSNNDGQKWVIDKLEEGKYRIYSKCNALCIEKSQNITETSDDSCNVHMHKWQGMDHSNQIWVLEPIYEDIRVKDVSLSVGSSYHIGLNFYIDGIDAAMYQEVHKVSINGMRTLIDPFTQPDGTRKVWASVDAKDMSNDIEIALYDNNDNLVSFSNESAVDGKIRYSVKKYLDRQISSGSEKEKRIAEALDIYGQATQLLFNYYSYGIAEREVDSKLAELLGNRNLEEEIGKYDRIIIGKMPEGIQYLGTTLTLETSSKYKHYFSLKEGTSVEDYVIQHGDTILHPEVIGNVFCVSGGEASCECIGVMKQLKIAGKDDMGESTEWSMCYSEMSYICSVLEKSQDISLIRLVKAMYLLKLRSSEYTGFYPDEFKFVSNIYERMQAMDEKVADEVCEEYNTGDLLNSNEIDSTINQEVITQEQFLEEEIDSSEDDASIDCLEVDESNETNEMEGANLEETIE